jgi:membrane-associated phospholipid phosphatase
VAYSRVRTGVHYPSDVAAGSAIGIACGILAGRLLRGETT